MSTLQGQVAIVTGGSRGIGRAIALAFAREGADIAFCHLDDAAAAAAVAGAVAGLGRACYEEACDVGDAAALRGFVARAEAALGPCGILVTNAGMNIRGPAVDYAEADFDRMVAVHLKHSFVAAQAVLPGMTARGRGRIITIASQLAFKGQAGIVPYCAVKAGILGLTRALALEVAASGVRVNAIAPGPVETDLTRQRGPDWMARTAATLPAGRVGQPEDIAATALLLAGPGGDFYVGACLSPNGGDVMH
jgi:3-oxoacyl-[acyl-carrier protein] reductase